MKTALILFVCMLVTGLPLVVVSADASQARSEQVAAEGAGIESEAEKSAFSKSLFEGRCQMCHQLPEPGMLKPNQWKLILGTMQQRMQQAGVPPLTAEETEKLLEYLAERAR